MKTLKTILQEVISGIKAWVDANTVHKTGDETINGVKTFPDGIVANFSVDSIAWEDITDKPSSFTPSSHTHTKSDVTDLLNSNFIPSANNSYDLGSSSYQWNKLYAKNYYYNGVAWGLDKANTWTGNNTFSGQSIYPAGNYGNKLVLKNTGLNFELSNGNSGLTDTYLHFIEWVDNNNTDYAILQSFTKRANTTTVILNKYRTDANTSVTAELRLENSGTAKSFYTNSNGDTDLGTSKRRWKTLNGINPGALSLPDYANDVSIDTTSWNKTGSMIVYTPLISGWLQLTIPGDVGNFLAILDSGSSPLSGQEFDGNGSARLYLTYPVIANRTYWIYIKASSIITARIVPCLGNV